LLSCGNINACPPDTGDQALITFEDGLVAAKTKADRERVFANVMLGAGRRGSGRLRGEVTLAHGTERQCSLSAT
jgi:hypothetical protein